MIKYEYYVGEHYQSTNEYENTYLLLNSLKLSNDKWKIKINNKNIVAVQFYKDWLGKTTKIIFKIPLDNNFAIWKALNQTEKLLQSND